MRFAFAILLFISTGVHAAETAVPLVEGASFVVGAENAGLPPNAGRERLAAIDGSLYSVVAPLFLGEGGGQVSYLRLFNGGSASASFTVKIVGSPTGRDYGTATYSVPAHATTQLALFQVLGQAGASIQAPDTNFSFYVQSAGTLAAYQHVTHSPPVSYFENASICNRSIQDAVRSASNEMVLPSVHTSRLAAAGYPAFVELHNYASGGVTYRFSVRDEGTGLQVGVMDFSAQGNSSYTIPWSQIESTIGWSPRSDQIRANLIVTNLSGTAPQILLGQTIYNQTLGVYLNMTAMCAITAGTSTGTTAPLPAVGANGIYKGTSTAGNLVLGIIDSTGRYMFLHAAPSSPTSITSIEWGPASASNGSFTTATATTARSLSYAAISNGQWLIPATSTTLVGSMLASYNVGQQISGTITYLPSGSTVFTLNDYQSTSLTAPTLAQIAGSYAGNLAASTGTSTSFTSNGGLAPLTNTWRPLPTLVISATGTISGSMTCMTQQGLGLTPQTCLITGAITPRSDINAYDVTISFPVANGGAVRVAPGVYTGVAFYDTALQRLTLGATQSSNAVVAFTSTSRN